MTPNQLLLNHLAECGTRETEVEVGESRGKVERNRKRKGNENLSGTS